MERTVVYAIVQWQLDDGLLPGEVVDFNAVSADPPI